MSTMTRIDTIVHRLRLGRKIRNMLETGAAMALIRAAWRVFVRLARATCMAPEVALRVA